MFESLRSASKIQRQKTEHIWTTTTTEMLKVIVSANPSHLQDHNFECYGCYGFFFMNTVLKYSFWGRVWWLWPFSTCMKCYSVHTVGVLRLPSWFMNWSLHKWLPFHPPFVQSKNIQTTRGHWFVRPRAKPSKKHLHNYSTMLQLGPSEELISLTFDITSPGLTTHNLLPTGMTQLPTHCLDVPRSYIVDG